MTSPSLNIKANRDSKKYSRSEQILRVLWALAFPLYRFSPRPLYFWRNWLLSLFGANLGKSVQIYNTAVVYFPWKLTVGSYTAIGDSALIYNLGSVTIGENVTISQRVHVCAGTHDYTSLSMPLVKSNIEVSDNSWIAADAFIGPDVLIGEGAVVGARAVVTRDVKPWAVVVGNPAKVIKRRELREE